MMDEDSNGNYYQFRRHWKLKSLSVVSKQFLSITNRLPSSIIIYDEALPCLPHIFQRFTNLNSLEILCQLSSISLDPKLLDLACECTPSANGLQAFSQNITILTTLTCFLANFLLDNNKNIFFVARCFPNLQRLDLNYCDNVPEDGIVHVLNRSNIRYLNLAYSTGVKLRRMKFEAPKLEVLNLSYTDVDDQTLDVISKNCRGLLQMDLQFCCCVTKKGVKYVVENCTQLRGIKLKGCDIVHADVVELESMVSSR
jgi:hypothetical protein